MTAPAYHGLLVLDKPGGLTSRDAVNRALGWFPRGTRIGHTGTLDPLATGVLVLGVGVGTRFTEYVQRMIKTYRAGVVLGGRSDTDDADGTVAPVTVDRPPTEAEIRVCLRGFVGEIEQLPPTVSATRVAGRRAYDLARLGETFQLQPRPVRIHSIELEAYDYPRLDIEVRCGKGTYIRSLARDLGERLGCGGYIADLRRMRVGPFEAGNGLPLDADAATARARLLPVMAAVVELPRLELPTQPLECLRHGQVVPWATENLADEVAVFDHAGQFAAVARVAHRAGQLLPVKVLPH